MSLDVDLYGEPETVECVCSECDNVHNKTVLPNLFNANITHNLNKMAEAAGIYKALWRPEEIGITKAGDLISFLEAGLKTMKDDPSKFIIHNPSNGWGSYKDFIPWIEHYLAACKEHPNATVSVSR